MTTRRGGLHAGWLIAAAFGLVLVALAWSLSRLARERRRADRAAMAADTLRAALDTSRVLTAAQLGALGAVGDSLAGATRLVVQLRQESDALDRVLRVTRTANAQLSVRVKRLSATLTDTVRVDSATGTRSARFQLRQPPYTIGATAALPPPPASGRLDVDIALDPATIALRLGCTSGPTARTNGVRSAVATAVGPSWLTLAVGRVEQAPEVCNPRPATVARLAWWRRCAPTIGVGYGVVAASDGKVYHGPTVAGMVDVLRCFR